MRIFVWRPRQFSLPEPARTLFHSEVSVERARSISPMFAFLQLGFKVTTQRLRTAPSIRRLLDGPLTQGQELLQIIPQTRLLRSERTRRCLGLLIRSRKKC